MGLNSASGRHSPLDLRVEALRLFSGHEPHTDGVLEVGADTLQPFR